jgi:hypothetical protein
MQIEKDFEVMFGIEKMNRLFEKWPQQTQVVLDLLKRTVKDKSVQQELEILGGEIDKGIVG